MTTNTEQLLREALTVAANRLDRLTLELGFETQARHDAIQWAQEARAALTQPAESALQKFEKLPPLARPKDPIERLLSFCSFAMCEQDWLDVEPFFDALRAQPAEGGEAWAKTASELNRFAHTGKWPEDSTDPPASQEQAAPAWSDAVCDAGFQAMEARGFRVGASDIGKDDMKAMFLAMAEAAKASQEQAQQPSGGEVVTRESALEAIEHVEQHNGPGRADEARRMLATPKPEPMTEQQRGNLVMEHLGLPALMGDKMSPLDAFTLGIEATERHYGITKGAA